jgi:PEP-CTERM motif
MAITVPLVVGTASDDVIINFDFSAQPTPPPYTGTILSFFHLDVSAAPAKIIFDYYDGLNGVGLLGSDAAEPTVTTTGSVEAGTGCPSATAFCTGVLDGIFSIGLHLTEGAATFSDSPIAPQSAAFNPGSENGVAGVQGTLGTRSVPEPGTFVLLGLALAGIGLASTRNDRR